MRSNQRRYLTSLADELNAQATRVRDLIGDAHWYTDGHQKEFLITGLLRRHLPSSTITARGFVVSPSEPDVRSKEQDVLVVDTHHEGPVFYQGGVVIAFPHTVLAAISVKTKMGKTEVTDSVRGISSLLNVGRDAVPVDWPLWTGAFFFDESPLERTPTLFYDYFSAAAEEYPVARPVLGTTSFPTLPGDMFASSTNTLFVVDEPHKPAATEPAMWKIRGYNCQGLATAIFLSSLLEHVATARGGSGVAGIGQWTDDGTVIPLAERERSFELTAQNGR